jgi:hypothetical protein
MAMRGNLGIVGPSSWFLLFAFLCLTICGPALADRRVALVIGNGAYKNAPQLPNPKNDAQDVAAALKRTDFETILGLDLDKAGMDDATIRFARAAREADVAVFYYSGHAMQFAGVNYLMPVDAKLMDEADLRRMVRVDDIVSDIQQAKNLRIMVLDSCRDNPLAEDLKRSIGSVRGVAVQRGLAKIDSPQGMVIAYSTQAGRTAEDGQGRNSPYTAAFLEHIEEANEIGTVFRRVSADVYEETKHTQLPELSLSLIGEFYLKGRLAAGTSSAAIADDRSSEAERAWAVTKDTTSQAVLEDFIRQFSPTVYGSMARARLEELKKSQTAVAAPPLSPPTVPSPSQQAKIAPTPSMESLARSFLEEYMRQSEGTPSDYLAFVQNIFDADVVYYGKRVTKQSIVEEQRKFVARWPQRRYLLKPETVQIACDTSQSTCRVSGDLNYRSTNSATSKVSAGIWHFEFRVVFSRLGAKIIEEDGRTVSRVN